MAQKNIIIPLSNADPAYIYSNIRYARIDNTVSPIYTSIPNVTANPFVIQNVPNGQYRIYAQPIFSDGRVCPEVMTETPICSGINSFGAGYDGTFINITYNADPSVDSVRVNISYPNGGSFSQVYTNGDVINILPPSDVFGTYFATMQPVCDPDTGFVGSATGQASFEIANPGTVQISVSDPLGGNLPIYNVTGIAGFTFGSTLNEGQSRNGFHEAFTGTITVNFKRNNGVGSPNYLALYVNNVLQECIEVTAGVTPTTRTFASASYLESDVIKIIYSNVDCDVSP